VAKKGRGRGSKIDVDRRPPDALIRSSLDLLHGGEHPFKVPTTREEWYKWTLEYLPIPIPKHRVCSDHDTPLDFFIDFVTGELEFFINVIFCSRESFKTYLLANGAAVKAILWPGCEILGMGGIQEQAKQGYHYWTKFWNQFIYANHYLVPDRDIQSMASFLMNGSNYNIGAFTEAMANSKRCQTIYVDEVDSVAPALRPILTDDLLNVPSEMNGVKPCIIFTSSARRAGGTMPWLLDEIIPNWVNRGICKVWNWCYKECTEKCHKHVGRCEKYFEKRMKWEELKNMGEFRTEGEQKIYRSLASQIGNMKKDCPLVISCRGDLHRAPEPIKPGALRNIWGTGGLIDKCKGLSEDAIAAQLDCRTPRYKGLLFDPALWDATINPDVKFRDNPDLEDYILVDWGSGTTAVIYLQEDMNTLIDYIVSYWEWSRRDPGWRIEQLVSIWNNGRFPKFHGDAENADMNKFIENEGIPVKRVPFGAPSAARFKSKLSHAIGICEKRLENGLIQVAPECEILVKKCKKLQDKPRGQDRFGVKDDHGPTALFTKYAEEPLNRNYDLKIKVTQTVTAPRGARINLPGGPVLVDNSKNPTFKFPDPLEEMK